MIHVKLHRAQDGETLESIAEQYNCTVDQIKQLNGFRTTRLEIGRGLMVPDMKNEANDGHNPSRPYI